jgi:hypothetical protein
MKSIFFSFRNPGFAGPSGNPGRDCDVPILGQVCLQID